MDNGLINTGFVQIVKLMVKMIGSDKKEDVVKYSNRFVEDAHNFVALLHVEKEIDENDLEIFKQEMSQAEASAISELAIGD